jgi:hypothetical protein
MMKKAETIQPINNKNSRSAENNIAAFRWA